jgi:DNA-binding IclR family transcriptional regulator
VAALSVTGPTFRLDDPATARAAVALTDASAALSHDLGAT